MIDTHLLIPAICAIPFTIAPPLVGYADLLGALKFGFGSTCDSWAMIPFVWVVPTVVVQITNPSFLDTLPVFASKLIRSASFIWKEKLLDTVKRKNVVAYCTTFHRFHLSNPGYRHTSTSGAHTLLAQIGKWIHLSRISFVLLDQRLLKLVYSDDKRQ